MGANEFVIEAKGDGPTQAYGDAVREARWQNGHAGYTGTIAETNGFQMFNMPDTYRPSEKHVTRKPTQKDPELWRAVGYAHKMIDENKIEKWGPAGCIALGDGRYVFFGIASS